jgi:hypothetical protein
VNKGKKEGRWSRHDTIVLSIGGCLTRAEAAPPGLALRVKASFSSRPELSGARSVNWRGSQDKESEEERALMPPEEDHGNIVISQTDRIRQGACVDPV